MRELMPGFRYDYVNHNGRYLEIIKESGLGVKELDSLSLKMMQSNNIPNLLALQLEEQDFNVKLYYKTESLKTFANYTRGNRISTDEFYHFLLSLLKILEDSKNYMLKEECYVLNEDFIFVGNNLTDIYLTYLPVTDNNPNYNLPDVLRELITDISDTVADLRVADLQKIRTYFKEARDDFSISELKSRLIEVMQDKTVPEKSTIKNREIEYVQKAQEEIASTIEPAVAPIFTPQVNINKVSEVATTTNIVYKELPPLTEREKVITFGIAILAIAFTWKTYLDFPTESLLYISMGVTLLVVAGVLIMAKVWRPGVSIAEETIVNVEEKANNLPSVPNYNKPAIKTEVPPVNLNNNKASSLPNHTTMFNNDGATELLIKHDANVIKHTPYIEIKRDKGMEKVEISSNNFIIGRNASAVNYVEDSSGVSRIHVEITEMAGNWSIRDLESKNGTYLNGEKLIPNKFYQLTNGDMIKIATINYIFYTGE